MVAPLILLAAGGTGGHLFPAEALSHALRAAGLRVALITDARAAVYASGFPADAIHPVPSATPSGRSPLALAGVGLKLAQGVLASMQVIRKLRPALVVGFGGYPTVPPLLAAALSGVPTLIHEQNAVIGRANRFLSRHVRVIATGFATVGGLSPAATAKCRHVGNPVRPAVLEAAKRPMPAFGGRLNLLVFGGSQGARVMSDIVPRAIERLTLEERLQLSIVQQVRAEDEERVRNTYAGLGVAPEILAFFPDLPERMAQAQLVIARAGASTVAELGVIGRASILVPLPGSLDQDQDANARTLETAGAAIRIPQAAFTPERLAQELSAYLARPERLTAMADAARDAGIPDAAERLAALVAMTAR
jgi:UDP-N-acetylglucosamine--N-acetylmuramyl-(pentapeptide) pyrophosphoryl-undecaprenol N-acetylglucosamine transferase